MTEKKILRMSFHGRIIDQLGLQTYQSPSAALAELVANSWDADANKVEIFLPEQLDENAEIVISDDGDGLNFEECEEKYLKIGYDRRKGKAVELTSKGRHILGRKGIGKFAGFGIAKIIRVETISRSTGEKTTFEMKLDELKSDKYIAEGGKLPAEYLGPSYTRKKENGTKITLKKLTIARNISKTQLPRSLARRFLLHHLTDDFKIFVDDKPIPISEDSSKIQYVFPRDYVKSEKPDDLQIDGSWGVETLSNKRKIQWRIFFFRDTIDEEELQGITVFSHGKLAQRPFLFNLTGGLGGQLGQPYMSGQVQADFVDELDVDPMATERQRINFELEETLPLLTWGQEKVKKMLILWKKRRSESTISPLEERISIFSKRINELPTSEASTITSVLKRIASVSSLTEKQFDKLAKAVLAAWEDIVKRER